MVAVNDNRKRAMGRKVIAALGGDVRGKTVAVLGLTFKPNTDDMRDAPAHRDRSRRCRTPAPTVRAYDPEGMEQAKPVLDDVDLLRRAPMQAMEGADALVIVTEWDAFRALDLERVKSLLSDAGAGRPAQHLCARGGRGRRVRLHRRRTLGRRWAQDAAEALCCAAYVQQSRGMSVSDRPLRIAMLGPIAWRTPPRAYGAWELVTSLLTEALVARGHHVTLFATEDSLTAATLDAVVPAPYSEDPSIDAKVWEMRHVAHAMERAGDFDVIHNQADFVPLGFSRLIATPMVMTLHARPSDAIMPMLAEYQNDAHYVAISDSDRHPDLRYAATILHGIDVDAFPFVGTPGEDLLFFGRLHRDKGPADAIRAAARSGRRLRMAGIVQDQRYFDEEVAPYIDGQRVVFEGALGGQARLDALGNASAMLHLIGFDEPFGLSVVEALACGTPVIAFRRGSMETLIDHGRTGFVVDTLDEAVDAIRRVGEIHRAACRAAVAERFGVGAMADAYVALYRKVLG